MPLSFITILRSDIDLGAILLGLEMFFLCLMIPLERASWDDSPRPDFSAYVRRKPRRGDRVIRGGKKVSERAHSEFPLLSDFPSSPVRRVAGALDRGCQSPNGFRSRGWRLGGGGLDKLIKVWNEIKHFNLMHAAMALL